eukprot:590160-Pleurochrysis_carterae.AAC.1
MRTVPDSADQQVRCDRDPLLAKNNEVLAAVPRYPGGVEYADRAYFSWEPAAAFVRKLDSTIAYQQRAGTQAATGAASLLSFLKNRLVEFRGRYPVSGA